MDIITLNATKWLLLTLMWSENDLGLVPQTQSRFMCHILWKCYDILMVLNHASEICDNTVYYNVNQN